MKTFLLFLFIVFSFIQCTNPREECRYSVHPLDGMAFIPAAGSCSIGFGDYPHDNKEISKNICLVTMLRLAHCNTLPSIKFRADIKTPWKSASDSREKVKKDKLGGRLFTYFMLTEFQKYHANYLKTRFNYYLPETIGELYPFFYQSISKDNQANTRIDCPISGQAELSREGNIVKVNLLSCTNSYIKRTLTTTGNLLIQESFFKKTEYYDLYDVKIDSEQLTYSITDQDGTESNSCTVSLRGDLYVGKTSNSFFLYNSTICGKTHSKY